MTRQGWADGKGLGSKVQGMADALDGDGQKPWDKKGFGYVFHILLFRITEYLCMF